MDEQSNGNAAAVIVILIVILLIVVGLVGGASFLYLARERALVVTQVEYARVSQERARALAEHARTQAEAAQAAASRQDSGEPSASQSGTNEAITQLLEMQQQAWNAGDLDQFMQTYWNSDELTFSSGGKTTRGWSATLERYREKYPDRETMGQLTLEGLEVSMLNNSAALVLGRWSIDRLSQSISGNFSLVVRHFDDGWKIVHDHSSQVADEG